MPNALRATSVGAYHVQRLAVLFTYLDAVVVDTPIFDAHVRGQIRDVQSVQERLERARMFRIYLEDQWAPLDGSETLLPWPAMSAELLKDIANVEARVLNGQQTRFY